MYRAALIYRFNQDQPNSSVVIETELNSKHITNLILLR